MVKLFKEKEEKEAPKKAAKKGAKAEKKIESTKAASALSDRVVRTILKPYVSEKTASSGDTHAFMVARGATKPEIKKAFLEMYGVRPVNVRIINIPSKPKRVGRIQGSRSAKKKALVVLPKGSNIRIFEGV